MRAVVLLGWFAVLWCGYSPHLVATQIGPFPVVEDCRAAVTHAARVSGNQCAELVPCWEVR